MIEINDKLIKGFEAIPIIWDMFNSESEEIQQIIIDIQNSIRNGRG